MGVNGSQQQGNFGGVIPGYMGGSDMLRTMGANKIGGVHGPIQRANQNLNQQNGYTPFDYQKILGAKDPYVSGMQYGAPINPGTQGHNGQIRGQTFNTGNGYNRLSPITIGQMQQESNAGNFQNLPDWMNGVYQNYTPWLSQDTMASNMSHAPRNAADGLYKAERDAGVGFGGLNNDIFRQGLGYEGAADHTGGAMRRSPGLDFGVNSEIPTRLNQLQRYLSTQENTMAANGRPIIPGQQPVTELQRGLFT
jgi:hypothetical protein